MCDMLTASSVFKLKQTHGKDQTGQSNGLGLIIGFVIDVICVIWS
jgi:hypothetical protein